MMTIKFQMDNYRVRSLCIEEGLYTCGDNKEYGLMLNSAREARTPEDIMDIARDIWEHSDKEDLINCYGEGPEELINNIANSLLRECCCVYIGHQE